jgi:hypothetical protein
MQLKGYGRRRRKRKRRRRWEDDTKHFWGGWVKILQGQEIQIISVITVMTAAPAMRYPGRCSLSVQLNYHALGDIQKDYLYTELA